MELPHEMSHMERLPWGILHGTYSMWHNIENIICDISHGAHLMVCSPNMENLTWDALHDMYCEGHVSFRSHFPTAPVQTLVNFYNIDIIL